MIEIHILWVILIGVAGLIIGGIMIYQPDPTSSVIENPVPAPRYSLEEYSKQEKDLKRGLGWRTKNGQWIPYPPGRRTTS